MLDGKLKVVADVMAAVCLSRLSAIIDSQCDRKVIWCLANLVILVTRLECRIALRRIVSPDPWAKP